MKTLKLWYFSCLVFAYLSLDTLVQESYEITYDKSNQTEPIQFLVCEKLSDLYPNRTEIDLKDSRDGLYNHLDSSIKSKRLRPLGRIEESILNSTRSRNYPIFNGRVCFIANHYWGLKFIGQFLSDEAEYFVIKSDTLDFTKMSDWNNIIDQFTVWKKEPPYSDCRKSNSRFHCLNDCFKSRFRLARYYYEGHEIGLIRLDYDQSNRTIAESERNCFDQCKRENCKLVQLISIDKSKRSKRLKSYIFKTETFEGRPKLSAFDYWLQIIGLVSSFAGLSLNEFASVAIEFVQSKVKRRNIRIALFCLKLAILFVFLASFGYLCAQMAFDHKAKENRPKENAGTRHFIQPNIVHLAICVDIGMFKNKTMTEIKRATDGALVEALEGIYLDYEGRSFRTDYHVRPKILFKNYRRCFDLFIQPNYEKIPSNPKLTFKFKKENTFPQFYLLSENENLNGKSYWYSKDHAFQKRITQRLRSSGKCIDYEKKYTNCTGRQNCVERCISKIFKEKYNKITFGLYLRSHVVDWDWFSETEWNTTNLIENTPESLKVYEEFSNECLQAIPNEEPCDETEFENTVEINRQTEEIDLQFDVVRVVEEEPSWYKLALDITSITSILFGLTVLSILQMTVSVIQTTLRVRENKIVLFLIYLLSSFGFTWHTYHILHLVIRGDLIATQHYEVAKRVQMPVMVFCFDIDEELIDRNRRLTGNYLEELTREMTPIRMFRNISYLNQSNEWTPYDLGRVQRFFFLKMKCFRIEINQGYEADQFHFSAERQVLRMNLIDTPYERDQFIHFITKTETEFSKISKFKNWQSLGSVWSTTHSATHESSLYKYEDRFSFIRKYFLSFQEDFDSNLQGQLLELERNEYNLRTLYLPLEQVAFGREIDEDLFEQLYCSSVPNKRTDLNYQQLFVENHLREEWHLGSDRPDFTLNLIFLQKVISSTNEENFGMLLLNLLNVLFIWFNLGVLDLHFHLHLPFLLISKTNKFMIFIFQCLKKLQSSLRELLTRRKPITRRVRPF